MGKMCRCAAGPLLIAAALVALTAATAPQQGTVLVVGDAGSGDSAAVAETLRSLQGAVGSLKQVVEAQSRMISALLERDGERERREQLRAPADELAAAVAAWDPPSISGRHRRALKASGISSGFGESPMDHEAGGAGFWGGKAQMAAGPQALKGL